ncbi:MAG: hypothetical protein AAGA56_10735 [Myxococcota bacterium]
MESLATEHSPEAKLEALEAQRDERITEAKQTHRRVIGYADPDFGVLVFRAPRRLELKRFTAEVKPDDADLFVACEALCLSCCVSPSDRNQVKAILEEVPGAVPQIATDLQELASLRGAGKKG